MIYKRDRVSAGEPNLESISKSAKRIPGCLICGGKTAERFSKVFRGLDVPYFCCVDCGHLTAGEISTDPSHYAGSYFEQIDTGWQLRNRRILDFIRLIKWLPAIGLSSNDLILDFGSGVGRLVADLNETGFNAYGFEPFGEPSALPDRVFSDWNHARRTLKQVGLVTCIEVLEHLRDPDAVLGEISKVLAPGRYLLISTETYEIGVHTQDWYYLNPGAGHVSIFSEQSLRSLLQRHRFEPVLRINDSVWLVRNVSTHGRSFIERGYFALSWFRVKSGLRLNFRGGA